MSLFASLSSEDAFWVYFWQHLGNLKNSLVFAFTPMQSWKPTHSQAQSPEGSCTGASMLVPGIVGSVRTFFTLEEAFFLFYFVNRPLQESGGGGSYGIWNTNTCTLRKNFAYIFRVHSLPDTKPNVRRAEALGRASFTETQTVQGHGTLNLEGPRTWFKVLLSLSALNNFQRRSSKCSFYTRSRKFFSQAWPQVNNPVLEFTE